MLIMISTHIKIMQQKAKKRIGPNFFHQAYRQYIGRGLVKTTNDEPQVLMFITAWCKQRMAEAVIHISTTSKIKGGSVTMKPKYNQFQIFDSILGNVVSGRFLMHLYNTQLLCLKKDYSKMTDTWHLIDIFIIIYVPISLTPKTSRTRTEQNYSNTSTKAIHTNFIASSFNCCPLVWFFTSRGSIVKLVRFRRGDPDLFSKITYLI